VKIIDLSPYKRLKADSKNDWLTKAQLILQYGWKRYQVAQAEDKVLAALNAELDNRYVAIRGMTLPNDKTPLPPLVLGPTGAYLFYVWPKAGFYRIREDQWEVMQRNARNYRPAKPNVVQEVRRMAKALTDYLSDLTGQPIVVTPLMVFADPATDIDAVRPAVKPLLPDGLRRYASQIPQKKAVLSPTTLLDITDAVRPRPKLQTAPKPKQRPKKATQPPKAIKKAERYFNFTPRQWLILGVLAFLVLLTLAFAIFLVLATAY